MTSVIKVAGLIKSFGQTRALDGLDVSVELGEVHGFLGPNGSGKTTTMRAKTSTLPPEPASPDNIPPQEPGLIALTVAEIKRLLNLASRTWRIATHHLHWTWWRRQHQARARW